MKDNFSNLHTQISELTCEFKHEINVVKSTLNELEKSVNLAWASIEDLQQESKALKDSKSTHQKMMDEQSAEIESLKADLEKLQAENEKLKPALKEAQENLVALENYTRRENLRFMNIPESRDENCQNIIYDVLENDLKMKIQHIRFHAVHRVGKPQSNGATPARPRPIIARFAVREDRDQLGYSMLKTGSSPQPDTVRHTLPKTLLEKSRKKGKPLYNPCLLLNKLAASRR